VHWRAPRRPDRDGQERLTRLRQRPVGSLACGQGQGTAYTHTRCGRRPAYGPVSAPSTDRRRVTGVFFFFLGECLAVGSRDGCASFIGQERHQAAQVRYYRECQTPSSTQKMAEVLCVYREVDVLKKSPDQIRERGNRCDRLRATRSREFTASRRRRRDCQPAPASTPLSRGIMVQTPWHAQPVGRDRSATGKVQALVRDAPQQRGSSESQDSSCRLSGSTATQAILTIIPPTSQRETEPARQHDGKADFDLSSRQSQRILRLNLSRASSPSLPVLSCAHRVT